MSGFKDIGKSLHDRADDLAEEHGDKIKEGIDKGADMAERKVPDQHDDKVEQAAAKAKDVVGDLQRPD
jgi:hypothetical protein